MKIQIILKQTEPEAHYLMANMNYIKHNFRPMNKKGNSIIEVIVVIVIITTWLVWAYNILNSWSKLALTTENRIKATNIAREWMEAVQNIRDTNWIKYSSDITDCWNVLDYNSSCIWNTTFVYAISSWSYVINQNWSLWYLSWITNSATSFSWYIKNFPIYFDDNWLITQSWTYTKKCNITSTTSCVSIFSREIIIKYPDTWTTNDKRMEVTSKVKWVDWWKKWDPYEINLSSILTNWKEGL